MYKVAVVILNWNGKAFLEQFMPSVMAFSEQDAHIVVADNASTDNSVAFLKDHYPSVEIIENKENGGFAMGYNQALQHVKATYYILLNSDIEVTPNWIPPLITYVEQEKGMVACQPKILAYHTKDTFEYAGAGGGYIDKYGYPFCRGRLFQTLEKDRHQYDDNIEVFWATGACMVISSAAFHQVGGFDEAFFAHMEEIDLCWRLKNNGYRIGYCGSSTVYHVGGGTLPKSSAKKTYLNFRNNLMMIYKNLPTSALYRVFFIRFFLDYIAGIRFLMGGGLADFKAVVKAHYHFYKALPDLRKKRKVLPKSPVSHRYERSLIFSYYFRKKTLFSDLVPTYFSR